MKFFRAAAPGMVVLAVLLCFVPAFASEAPDPAGAYAPEAGEVLTNDFDSAVPAGDESFVDDLPTPDGDGPVLDDIPSDTDGDNAPVDEVPSDLDDGFDSDGFLSNPDDRTYTTVIDIGDGKSEYVPGNISGSLPEFLRAMFGEYTPKPQIVTTYFDGQLLDVSAEYVPGIAGMDMEWIASVILFGLVVYCLFRLLGGMVR